MTRKLLSIILTLCLLLTMAAGAMAEPFTGTAKGFGGDVTVTIEVADGKISAVSAEGASETTGIGSRAIEELPAKIVEAGTWDVETLTGATFTSEAVKNAAKAAMEAAGLSEKADLTVAMKPGIYTSQKNGFALCEKITVTVIVDANKIIDIKIDEVNISDTPPMVDVATDVFVPRILETQSIGIDAIAGVTMTTNAVKAAVEDCLKQALIAGGSDPAAVEAFRIPNEQSGETKIMAADVLVVGMGGSGVMTAMSAAEGGANVLAIEKSARYGGTTGLTSEVMAINPPRIQAEYNDSKDYVDLPAMREAWLAYTEGDAKEEMVDKLLYGSGEAIDWLHYEHDFEFDYIPKTGFTAADVYAVKFQYLPNSVGANKAYIDRYFDGLIADYKAAGGRYMLETEAYGLIQNSEGKVVGVKAKSLVDGTEYEIYADSVVLATGGFAGNGEMQKKYLSDEYFELKGEWKVYGLTSNDGKMIQAALDIGAGTYNIGMPPMVHNAGTPSFLAGYETNVVEGQMGMRTGRPLVWSSGDLPLDMAIAVNSLSVNKHGERFTNEEQVAMLNSWIAGPRFYSIWSSEQINGIIENGLKYEPSGPATIYLGYQGAIPAGIPIPNAYAVLDDAIAQGIAFKGATLDELAATLGMDPATLKGTVDTYNAACEAGEDAAFGKKPEYLDKIGEGPYYAILGAPWCYTTCGALDINTEFEVLAADGATPIGGLYAVGTDSMGVLFSEKKAYVTFGGAANGWALTSGYQCGKLLGEKYAK